ncbi:HNH endonuclease signature motif containing protein [Rhizobium leguminosarum]
MAELSYAQVSALLKYDSETGKLYWLERPVEMFSDAFLGSEWSAKKWNTRYAGKEAFTALDGGGYHYGQIFKRPHRAHRVGWLLHTGFWPEHQIDHINGVRTDNRIANLRDVTHAENNKNNCLRSDNYSGHPGVGWCNKRKMWRARIMELGRETHIGYFTDFDTAVQIRKKAEIDHNFHPNHGRD